MKYVQLCTAAVIVALDQFSKHLVLAHLVKSPSVLVIPGLLQLTYVENRGSAFGMFQGHTMALSVVTSIVLLTGVVLLLRGFFSAHPLLSWCITAILGGGFGNLIDRLFRGFVVDFLDISPLFSFPVFNLADCFLVCGTALLLVYYFFMEPRLKAPDRENGDAHG